MKNAFPHIRFVLPGILLLCPTTGTPAKQEPRNAEKSATAFKTPERAPQNQSEARDSGTQTNHPEGSSGNGNQPKSGNSETTAQQFYDSATNLYSAGRFDEAISAFLQSARLKPDNALTHYGLGMAYAKSKFYKEASDSFKRAVKFKPEWPEANFRVGMMAYVLGDKTQANDSYSKLRKLNSPLANTLYRVIREDGAAAGIPESVPSDSKPADFLPVSTAIPETETTRKETLTKTEEKLSPKPEDPGKTTRKETLPKTEEKLSPKPEDPGKALSLPVQPVSLPAKPVSQPAQPVSLPTPTNAEPSSEQALTAIYKVGAGDVLDVRLLNSTIPRSTLFTVMDGGLIDFPVAGGPILVGGFTTEEIQSRIAAELKRRAVEVNSQVAVSVRQYTSHAVIVTGLVANPGTRFLRREAIPLYVLLAEVQPRLDAGRLTVLRAGAEAQTFDLSDSNALATLIRQGDVINVGPRPQEFYYIGGRINYPGQKAFQLGITLLQAILAAGGPSQNEHNIDLSREGADGRLTTFRVSLKEIKSGKQQDPKLQPGDRIEVVR